MILLFLGIFSLVFLAAQFFISDTYTVPDFFEHIPGIDSIYNIIRSLPSYFREIGEIMFGKKNSISFIEHLENTKKKDLNFRTSLQEYFTDTTLPFKYGWIFVPFVNLIFLPKLFMCRTTQYVLAIGQGLVITLLAILIGFLFSFTSPLELFLLFPIFYGIASIK
jgi:hypothetical protein